MSDKLPSGWVEVAITSMELNNEIATGKYSTRIRANDILMLMFQKAGIRMEGRFSLMIATPYEIMQDHAQDRVIVRQGPAPVTT